MEISTYKDLVFQLGLATMKTVNRMPNAEFKQLGEEMLRVARTLNDQDHSTQMGIYDAYSRCMRLMSYLQAVEDMGIIDSEEFKHFEIQILSLTDKLQVLYKANC